MDKKRILTISAILVAAAFGWWVMHFSGEKAPESAQTSQTSASGSNSGALAQSARDRLDELRSASKERDLTEDEYRERLRLETTFAPGFRE